MRSKWNYVFVFLLAGQFLIGPAFAGGKKEYKKIDVGSGEMGISATVIEGPPIKADQVLTKDHPEYARGMVCVECHDVGFDAVTNSTRQFMLNYSQLPNDKVWGKIVVFLPGRERFVLATSFNNKPIATTVDMVMDKVEKVFYVLCEKGTEKLMQIRQNPQVCAASFQGWKLSEARKNKDLKKEWRSVQIRGTAEVIESRDPRFEELLGRYKPVRMTTVRAKLRFDLVRITPLSIVYFDTNLAGEHMDVYQKWERGK